MSQMTPEQNSVISDRTDRLTVRAAAGSGKTRTLVARYLRYIKEDGLTPDQILTITFTRKAAAEMKKKIVSELRDAGLNQQAQSAETGPISTIHGFLERALRENAIAAGISVQRPTCPTLVVLGEQDTDVPHQTGLALATWAGADVLRYHGMSHVGPLLSRRAEGVARMVMMWCQSLYEA